MLFSTKSPRFFHRRADKGEQVLLTKELLRKVVVYSKPLAKPTVLQSFSPVRHVDNFT